VGLAVVGIRWGECGDDRLWLRKKAEVARSFMK